MLVSTVDTNLMPFPLAPAIYFTYLEAVIVQLIAVGTWNKESSICLSINTFNKSGLTIPIKSR